MIASVSQVAARDLSTRPHINFPWRRDIMAMEPDMAYAVTAAGAGLVTEAMLAAVIARETDFRNIFQAGVPRGPGCGVGPCQITAGLDWSDPAHPKLGGLDMTIARNNMLVAVRDYLVPALRAFPSSHQAAFDAYNLGVGGVSTELENGQSPDRETTDGNYGISVMHGWISFAAIIQSVQVDWSTWAPQ